MSFYTSLTGLNAATSQLAVTSNNIANVGTTAFKRSRADFGDIFSTSPLKKASSQIGQGVLMKGVAQEFSQGNISTSGNALDMAITGDGFFSMKTADGLQDIYTRNGAFMLNDDNQVVNSAGQKLMAASVDSSGTADLGNLNSLTIPSKTTGDAAKTNSIQMGVNLPVDAAVLNVEDFDRTDPTTYNESTALTVYDESGQGYLATVYYVKTQNATTSTPESKWQTFFYIGDKQFDPRLQQATDEDGKYILMNKYGETRVVSTPSYQKTPMYRLDENTTPQNSVPATILGDEDVATAGPDTNGDITLAVGDVISFDLSVDGSAATEVTYTIVADDLNNAKMSASALAAKLTSSANNAFGTAADANLRYGIKISYQNGVFQVASGTTGDASSIQISSIEDGDLAKTKLGFSNKAVVAEETDAVRGQESLPAKLVTDAAQVDSANQLKLLEDITFDVTINGITGTITLDKATSDNGLEDGQSVAARLEALLNYDVGNDSNLIKNGQKVYGVTVEFSEETKQFTITSPMTGSNSVVEIIPQTSPELFGLSVTTRAQGETSTWVPLAQYTTNGRSTYVSRDADGNYSETTDPTDVAETAEYWPVFLDPGELTFTLNGELVSPFFSIPFTADDTGDSSFSLGSMAVDLSRSTQYGSSFSVLSQSQDGSPEGDLMGLEIGDDGLVSASFSNGTQKSLGKIVLVNFSSPSGMRQIGDGSYLASSSSGTARVGEAGSSGFGSIRAGAIERSNVDLTQELVDLITAQRNFQANAKAIETSNTLTQAIINIRG
jgi:flagellar hook protein FlgE